MLPSSWKNRLCNKSIPCCCVFKGKGHLFCMDCVCLYSELLSLICSKASTWYSTVLKTKSHHVVESIPHTHDHYSFVCLSHSVHTVCLFPGVTTTWSEKCWSCFLRNSGCDNIIFIIYIIKFSQTSRLKWAIVAVMPL